MIIYFTIPSAGSSDKIAEIEMNYRDRLQEISKDYPFMDSLTKRLRIIVTDEEDVKIVTQFKVVEEMLKAMDISGIYDLPKITVDESYFLRN